MKIDILKNSRARRKRISVDVRAGVTGDPPVIELDDAAFSLLEEKPSVDPKPRVMVCDCCGVIMGCEPVDRRDESATEVTSFRPGVLAMLGLVLLRKGGAL